MKFQENQILEAVRSPKRTSEVEKGRKYESRLRLFTESMFKEDLETEPSWEEFRKFMTDTIKSDKEIRLNEFIQYPLSSISITESLMSDLYKVFDAGNSYFHVDTVKKKGGQKIQLLIQDLNIVKWIQEKGKQALSSKPNLIVVIDKDEEGNPYLIDVDNKRLLDFELKDDGVTFEYIMFTHSIKVNEDGDEEIRIALYDESNYHVILKLGGEYSIEKSVPHTAGYCPARMYLKDRLNSKAILNRKSPIVNALPKLMEWQLFDIYKFYTDHYAPFPVTEMVRSRCGRDNCINGNLIEEESYYSDGQTKVRQKVSKCPTCAEDNVFGVGTKIMIEPQSDKDEPTASGKFRMISNDVGNLKYLQEKLDTIENYIKAKIVGVDDIVVKESVNEKQMEGAFESKTNVLLKIKNNLDELYEWIVDTLGAVYISGSPLMVQANFGTEWYLMSEDDIQERLKTAKEGNFPKGEIDMIYLQLIETKYKGNPEKVERLKIMNLIDPAPYDSLETKIKKQQIGIISLQELIISERLLTFVERFEQQNGSIVDFANELETELKIKNIVKQFNKYADEQISKAEPIRGGEETDE